MPYLRDLGISHLYLSPSFQARPGSTHGYDVIDPTRVSDELGGEAEFRALAGAAPRRRARDRARRRAQPHGGRRRQPLLGGPGAARASSSTSTRRPARYRRFFDIDDLAGVRQEDPEVFAETHELVLSLVREGVVDGLRIDHPDGLADPAGYLERLRDGGVERVWVEKILDPGERLRDWPVTGTVGYEFLNDVVRAVRRPGRRGGADRAVGAGVGRPRGRSPRSRTRPSSSRHAARSRPRSSGSRASWATAGRDELEALERALASLPVYRTYVEPRPAASTTRTARVIRGRGMAAPSRARCCCSSAPRRREFVTRFQQTTPAVMAKGVEDTAFYRYARLLALNDVGGDPCRFGIDVEQLPRRQRRARASASRENLLTTQTHDAKRSADVRARIGALASDAGRVGGARRALVRADRRRCARGGAPDDVERYFLFQTLVGAWPIERRADRGLHGEGAARGQAQHQLDRAERRLGGGGQARSPRAVRPTARSCDDFEPFVARVAEAASAPRSASSCSS